MRQHHKATSRSWIKSAVIYQILIDRFAGFDASLDWTQPRFVGGNLAGIIKNMSYLQDLGVDAIWITPHYATAAYHGYHITDYFQVDPHFGSQSIFKELIETAHAANIRVLADFVPNHCSREHPFFQEARTRASSSYRNWFYFTHWPDEYLSFLSVKEIPKLNLDYPPTRNHIWEAAKYWLSQGLDGFRLDHVIGPSHQFWHWFHSRVKKQYPYALLLGEAWMMGIHFHELKTINISHKLWRWLRSHHYQGLFKQYIDELDGVLDFGMQQHLQTMFSHHPNNSTGFRSIAQKYYHQFPKDFILPAFLDNHDMDRFLFTVHNNTDALIAAAQELFKLPQPVILYYGTETGLSQPKSLWEFSMHGDVMARQPMNWDSINWELHNTIQMMIAKRKRRST